MCIRDSDGSDNFEDKPYGRIPSKGALDTNGLNISDEDLQKLFVISKEEGLAEVTELREYFKKFGDKLPPELSDELNKLEERYNNL